MEGFANAVAEQFTRRLFRDFLKAILVVVVLAGITGVVHIYRHRDKSLLGVRFPFPDVPLQIKAELFELRLGYRQNLDMIAQLEEDQRKIDAKIADKLKGQAKDAPISNEVLDLRLQSKQDADTIAQLNAAQPTIDAAWNKKVAEAVKAAHLPDNYTIGVPNLLSEIKFMEKPKPDAGKK